MKSKWKALRWVVLPVLVVFTAGCSGINTTQSVSPASFFLPGLIHHQPAASPADAPVPLAKPDATILAQAD
jgi:hypothetical protein